MLSKDQRTTTTRRMWGLIVLLVFYAVSTWADVSDLTTWLFGGNRRKRHSFILKACDGPLLLSNISSWIIANQQNQQGNLQYNYATLIDPRSNGQCAWLKAPYLGHYTGIGHAISVTNYYIKLAARLKLTLFSDFGPTGHQQSAEEVGTYFGFGCLFANSRHPPPNANVIHVTRENLVAMVDKYRSQLSCRDGSGGGTMREETHTVFDLGESSRGQPTDCDFEASRDIVQQIFSTSYGLYKRMYTASPDPKISPNNTSVISTSTRTGAQFGATSPPTQIDPMLPVIIRQAIAAGDLLIVVHVRRGDVLEAHVRTQRLVNWHKQETGVRSVLKAIERMGAAAGVGAGAGAGAGASTTLAINPNLLHQHIRIVVVTEQAPDHDTILDYDLHTDRLSRINITHSLSDICYRGAGRRGCSTHVLKDDDVNALQSFSVLCQAHILLATRSGFSHLAGAICPSVRLIVAAPFWCPYPTAGSRGATGGALTAAPAVVMMDEEGKGGTAGAATSAGTVGAVGPGSNASSATALEEEVWVKMKSAFG